MDLVVAARLASDVIAAGDARAWFNVGWLKAQSPRAIATLSQGARDACVRKSFWRGAHRR